MNNKSKRLLNFLTASAIMLTLLTAAAKSSPACTQPTPQFINPTKVPNITMFLDARKNTQGRDYYINSIIQYHTKHCLFEQPVAAESGTFANNIYLVCCKKPKTSNSEPTQQMVQLLNSAIPSAQAPARWVLEICGSSTTTKHTCTDSICSTYAGKEFKACSGGVDNTSFTVTPATD